jgi:hypothetical protein
VKQDFTPFVYVFMVEIAGAIDYFSGFPVDMGAVSVWAFVRAPVLSN